MTIVEQVRGCAQSNPTHPVRNSCQLTIQANGTSYFVTPQRSESHTAATVAYSLQSANEETAYVVAQRLVSLTCTCSGFQAWQGPPTCKHIRALLLAGLLSGDYLPLTCPDGEEKASLDGIVQREADTFRALDTPASLLIARTLDELATKIRMTQAKTPDEYDARIEILDAGIREQWEAIGYEAGRHAECRGGKPFVG